MCELWRLRTILTPIRLIYQIRYNECTYRKEIVYEIFFRIFIARKKVQLKQIHERKGNLDYNTIEKIDFGIKILQIISINGRYFIAE